MTLDEILLQKLSEWRAPPGRHALSAAEGGWAVDLVADRADAVGCLVWELVLRRTDPAEGDLRAWAERAAARVTGLVEPLVVHEIDAGRGEALLRSDAPARRGGSLFYYELALRGTSEAVLRRYRATHEPGQRREQVGFALTHESVAGLVARLTAEK
jgi:hypothetical protein